MKKTIILACAVLSASAMADTLGAYTLATTGINSAAATATGTYDLSLTLDSVVVSPDQGNDYKHWSGMAVPNINVGNNTGTWTMTFTLANTGSSTLTLDSISLDVIGVTNSGDAQSSGGGTSVVEGETWLGATEGNTNKPIDFTLTLGDYSSVQTVNVVSTTADPTYTFTTPIELAAGDSVTFTVLADNNAAYNAGAFTGLKGVTVSGTAAIPEPATATLSLLALAGLAARRRRK